MVNPISGCSGEAKHSHSQQVVVGVVAKHLIRQITHLVSLQDNDHPRLVEHRGAAMVFGGIDEVDLFHR